MQSVLKPQKISKHSTTERNADAVCSHFVMLDLNARLSLTIILCYTTNHTDF